MEIYKSALLVVGIAAEAVADFLRDNPAFLDSFVASEVSRDRIERWQQRKQQQQPRRGSNSSKLNGKTCNTKNTRNPGITLNHASCH